MKYLTYLKIFTKSILIMLTINLIFIGLYYYNNRLFLWEANLIWPHSAFVESDFKLGTTDVRAKMAAELIRSNQYLGIESDKIPRLLGNQTGDYYHNELNTTYLLTDKGNADWVLTFVSGDNGKIEQIFIRKNCCSITKKIYDFVLFNILGPGLIKINKTH